MNPSKHSLSVLGQVFKLIPGHLIPKLAEKHGVSNHTREISPTSHVLSLLYAQLSHAISLNDVCDSLRYHSGYLSNIRESVAPSRNGLSNANRTRNPEMAEDLFWSVMDEFRKICPDFFSKGRKYRGIPSRFRRTINIVDSSTIRLFANSLDWAQHRNRKAAAKMHLRLDLHTFLPKYVLVKSAGTSDPREAYELCSDVKSGEIVIFDKAYTDFSHLYMLSGRGIFWVTRAKENMVYEVVGQHSAPQGNIVQDVIIRLSDTKSKKKYPMELRMVEAIVEINGKPRQMIFLSNNMKWAASSICDLYKSRWGIEVFFKEMKQTLQLADFLGYNENAIKWQVWTALLAYIILRFISYQGRWKHSFTRLFTVIRGVLWSYFDLFSLLDCCGTAHVNIRMRAAPEQCYLPGFAPT
jgi:hypothetical protein